MLRKDEDMESYKNLDQMIQEVCENEDMDLNQVFDMPEDNRERIQRTEVCKISDSFEAYFMEKLEDYLV